MPNQKMSLDEILSKRQGHIVSTSRGDAVVKAVRSPRSWNKEERSARFVMTSESRDRYGDIVSQSGAQLDRFLENPVALLFHNSRGWPIGKWSDVEVKLSGRPKRMEGKLNFMGEGLDPDADRAAIHVENDTIRTVSIGFIPMEAEAIRDAEGNWLGIDFKVWELVECSLVPIPANPDALIKGAAGDNKMLRDFVEDVLDNWRKAPDGLFLPVAEYEKLYKTTVEKIAADKTTHEVGTRITPDGGTIVLDLRPDGTSAMVSGEAKHVEDETVLIDDCRDMNVDQINRLCGREVLFLTSIKKDASIYGGTVIASGWDSAVEHVAKRGLGETVIGQAVEFVASEADGMSKAKFMDATDVMREVKIGGVKWSAEEIVRAFEAEKSGVAVTAESGNEPETVVKTIPAEKPAKENMTLDIQVNAAQAVSDLKEVNGLMDTVKAKFLEIFGITERSVPEIKAPPALVPGPTPEQIAAVKAKTVALRKRAEHALS